jgi:DNA-binding HxlR family transcriptional regulator
MYDAVRAVIEPKWSLDVLVAVSEDGPLNYTAVEERFNTSSDVITKRLHLLAKYGLVDRTEHTPKDVRYSITDLGVVFLQKLDELDGIIARE